jgi:hypothetical protein
MRGSIRKRYKDSWNIILDKHETDAETGASKRRQTSAVPLFRG